MNPIPPSFQVARYANLLQRPRIRQRFDHRVVATFPASGRLRSPPAECKSNRVHTQRSKKSSKLELPTHKRHDFGIPQIAGCEYYPGHICDCRNPDSGKPESSPSGKWTQVTEEGLLKPSSESYFGTTLRSLKVAEAPIEFWSPD